jgi:hypothetical protein
MRIVRLSPSGKAAYRTGGCACRQTVTRIGYPLQHRIRGYVVKKLAPKNAFYAQSGGVSAVINASACGVIETARRNPTKIAKVFAGRHGIVGALSEDLIDTS